MLSIQKEAQQRRNASMALLVNDAIARRISCIKTYTELVEYWSGHRMVALWQTPEFIADQLAHCKLQLAEHEKTLIQLKSELTKWES